MPSQHQTLFTPSTITQGSPYHYYSFSVGHQLRPKEVMLLDQHQTVPTSWRLYFNPSRCDCMAWALVTMPQEVTLLYTELCLLSFLPSAVSPSLTDSLLGFSLVCASSLLTEWHTDHLLLSVRTASRVQIMCFCVPSLGFWSFTM